VALDVCSEYDPTKTLKEKEESLLVQEKQLTAQLNQQKELQLALKLEKEAMFIEQKKTKQEKLPMTYSIL